MNKYSVNMVHGVTQGLYTRTNRKVYKVLP